MSRVSIPNYNVLHQELARLRDNAVWEFWYFEDEIWNTYELVSEVVTNLRAIDKLVEETTFNQAIEIGRRFTSLANSLFSIEPHFKQAFTTNEKTLLWRGLTSDNILHLVEQEVSNYVDYFRGCCSEDFVDDRDLFPEEKDVLLALRAQIRLRVARDRNEATVENISQWTPQAEIEARRLIQAGEVNSAKALQHKLSIKRQAAQGLYRHITGKKKKRYQSD